MVKHFFILTLKGMRYRPMRSWLTILGIVIGVMLVVVILSLGSGIKGAVNQALQMFGSELIQIYPGKETNPLIGFLGGQKFEERDLMQLENIDGVEFVAPMEIAMFNVEYRGEKKASMVHAAPWAEMIKTYEQSQGIKLEEGRWPRDDRAHEVVLGYKAGNNLFNRSLALGDDIVIKSRRMKVVGVVSEVGEQMSDNIIYLSLDILRDLTGTRGKASSAFVKVNSEANVDLVARHIEFRLSQQESVRDFSVITPDKADRLVGNVLSVIELVLVAVGLISLLVGAVGIMNTMYTSVLERTRQIGVMKAIGASADAIMTLFLVESGIIGMVGGGLGVVLGIGAAYIIGLVAATFGVRGLFSFWSLDWLGFAVVLTVTFIIGVVSGLLPASQAAKMEPAEALRYE